jgi:hypothetical protein
MTILFIIRNHGYLRNYESTLRLLAERGHRVMLVSRGAERHHAVDTNAFLMGLSSQYPGITVKKWPLRKDGWTPLAEAARSVRNYARYLRPRYRTAHKLRARAAAHAHKRGANRLPAGRLTAWIAEAGAALAELAIPPDPAMIAALASVAPDVVVVTPLVDFNSYQVDYVKAAQALGIPTVWCVASWDNLSNKGITPVVPDRVLVWNDTQRREAMELQGVPSERVVVTGAQLFDVWFTQRPSTTRDEFTRHVGLPDRPFLLYLCSSIFIVPDEPAFVRNWLERLRASGDPELQQCGVLIRPHPGVAPPWANVNFRDFGPVVVWPRAGDLPIDAEAKRHYFDSLFHCSAVAGINTSGMIEAGIVGRRSFTLLAPEFADTQAGTVHFEYLTSYGFLTAARTWDEHIRHLAAAVRGETTFDDDSRQRMLSFVRPFGCDDPSTPRVADAIESAALVQRGPGRRTTGNRFALRVAMTALAPWLRPISVPPKP